ncbi:MAG: hypothetical protein AAGC67_02630 [Myxococcota bacterium]
MNARTAAGIAVGLLIAFALGWLARGGPPDVPASPRPERAADRAAPAALETALSLEDPLERTRALLDLLDRTDPALALPFHEKLRELRQAGLVDEIAEILVAHWWAEAAPDVAFAHPIPPRWPDRHPWVRTVLQEWTPRDPAAAAEAAQALADTPGSGRTAAARAVVDAWLELETLPDPAPLFGLLEGLEPIVRGGALLHIARSLIEDRGVEPALDYARGIRTSSGLRGNMLQEFLARTGVALLDVDSARAVAWATEYADTDYGPGIHKHVAYYWALREGRPAMDWAVALPDDAAKSTILKRAWISFSRKHEADARAWLAEHPPHPLMRATYRQFVRELGRSDPQAGLAVADRAREPAYRDELRAAAAEGWIVADPRAARVWLADAGLPPALAAKVRAAGRRNQPARPAPTEKDDGEDR